VQKQSYEKNFKNKAPVKKESILLRNNRFIFCAVKHILRKDMRKSLRKLCA